MKKLSAVAVVAAMALCGCAVKQPSPRYQLDKQANRTAIQSGKQVEIFYHADEYVVVDLGGSKSLSLLGLLGPIGLLAGLGADAAHKLDVKSRTERRSEEFSALITDNLPGESINERFARQIGDLLEKDGRQVKVTQVTRPSGSGELAQSTSNDLVASDGYMQLMLRVSTGYGSTSATDSYKPVTIIEYALKDSEGTPLMSRAFTRFYGESDKTYMTYAGLLGDYKAARDELGARLTYWSEPVYTEIFRFAEPVAAE
jgi:hypothetical protein